MLTTAPGVEEAKELESEVVSEMLGRSVVTII